MLHNHCPRSGIVAKIARGIDMADSNSIEYYRARERRERALAEAATNPAISAIHIEMAERYSELTTTRPRQPAMRLVLIQT